MTSAPKRTLVISSRLRDGREKALRTVFEADGPIDILWTGQPLGNLDCYGAVVLDGPQEALDAESISLLQAFVQAGGSLVAVGCAPASPDRVLASLLGVVAGPPQPQSEIFGKTAAPQHELLRRLEREFPVIDTFSALNPLDGDTHVLLNVNWALRDRPVVIERMLGEGRVVVTSLGNTNEALQTPALSTLLRRALRPRNGRREERPFGVGLVGYGPQGGMGFVHGTAVTHTDGLELIAVCDQAAERREAARRDFPTVRTYASVQELAADDAIDLVIVATPPVTHAAISLTLLRAGKHVAVEKPLCLTLKEADELIATARAHNVVLTVNQSRRWDPDFLAVRRAVETGLLGELFNMETFVGGFAHPCRYWHSDREISGGTVYDWGAHYIDWILQLMPGMPTVVSANAHKRVWHDVTNFDQIRVRLLWADGREAEFLHSEIAAIRKPKFYLQGTAGTLVGHYRPLAFERIDPAHGYVREEPHYAEAPADLVLARYESGYGITETRLPLVPQPPFPFHRNLADHLHLGEPLAVTPESVRRVIAVLEAAERSARGGAVPVELHEL